MSSTSTSVTSRRARTLRLLLSTLHFFVLVHLAGSHIGEPEDEGTHGNAEGLGTTTVCDDAQVRGL